MGIVFFGGGGGGGGGGGVTCLKASFHKKETIEKLIVSARVVKYEKCDGGSAMCRLR